MTSAVTESANAGVEEATRFATALLAGRAVFIFRHTLLDILQRADTGECAAEDDPEFKALIGQMTAQLYGDDPSVIQLVSTVIALNTLLERVRTNPHDVWHVDNVPFPVVNPSEDASDWDESTSLGLEQGLFVVHDSKMVRYTLARNLLFAAGFTLSPGLDVDKHITRHYSARGPVTAAERASDAEEEARSRAMPPSKDSQRQGAFASIIRGRVLVLKASDLLKVADVRPDTPGRSARLEGLVRQARAAVWNGGIQTAASSIADASYTVIARQMVDGVLAALGSPMRMPIPANAVTGLAALPVSRMSNGHRVDLVDKVFMFIIRHDSVSHQQVLADVLRNIGVSVPTSAL